MEAIKGDTLSSVYKSLEVLSEHPRQVLVLKKTFQASGLHGGSRGLARRLVDVPRTREFEIFCRALKNAGKGEPSMQAELIRLGREASTHFDSIKEGALRFAQIGKEAAKAFTREEQGLLRQPAPLSRLLLKKLYVATVWQTEALFPIHPAVKRQPTVKELPNTYIFRSALCHLLLVLKWAYDGGTSPKSERIRNDMVDVHFSAYSTYFDDLLSKDSTALSIASAARSILKKLPALAPEQ